MSLRRTRPIGSIALALALALAVVSACGARSEILAPAPSDVAALVASDSRTDAPTVPVTEAALPDASLPDSPAGPSRCNCPGSAGFVVCTLPLMCCPVTGTCENPAGFSCTGPAPPPCP